MPAEKLIVSVSARKQIKKLPTRIQSRIEQALDTLLENPPTEPKLQGELAIYHKFRIGDYRLIYRFDSKRKAAIVMKVEYRQGIYK